MLTGLLFIFATFGVWAVTIALLMAGWPEFVVVVAAVLTLLFGVRLWK